MAVLPPDPVFCLKSTEMGPVNSICFHHNERILAGTVKGGIHLWDLQTNRPFLNFDIGTNPITSLHHTDENLFSQEKGGTIKCWSMTNTGYLLQKTEITNHVAFCRSDYINNKEILLYPKDENSIGFITLKNYEIIKILKPDQDKNLGHISCIRSIQRNGQDYILAGYESGNILTWDIRDLTTTINNTIGNDIILNEFPMTIDYDPITNRGLCGGSNDKLTLFSYQRQSMDLIKQCEIGIKNAGINCIKIRPDQKVFVSGGWDGRIRIFSWKSLRPLAVLTEHKNGGVMDIAFSEGKVTMWKANIMAAAGVDGQITLWDLYN